MCVLVRLNGIPEIAIEIAKAQEDILWTSTDPEDSRTMFAYAIAHRQEEVAKFLYERKADKFCGTDEDGNNNLHPAARLAPHFQLDRISGAALRLQSELRWFKSVEAIVPRFYNEQKNKNGETPYQVFVKEHENLLKVAEDWVQRTAQSSTFVGALIFTSMFAAAFTVPVAFCATLFMMLRGQRKEVIPITVLAGIPIMCFALLQFPLLVEIIALTLRPDIFDRKTATARLVEWLGDNIPILPFVVDGVIDIKYRLTNYLRSRNG
ncbi:hypothetical protein SLEP1_g55503 [Rubroshorea leprosula]|uniref:Ankyrin repeat protein n=1 Tax=Rubroshorea leprosula TaxID=152421 RepID=A0AAV5MFP1_9ROSI|nr:hypothetical protein SLEP1_g55503 [Rubroshorea leprosula]